MSQPVLSQLQAASLQTFFGSNPRLILGSGSSSRQRLLEEAARQHGFSFEVLKADIDEKALNRHNADPSALVLTLGRYKAASLCQALYKSNSKADLQGNFLVTGDQIVVFEGCIREKPTDKAQARQFIRSYSGSSARTIGSCVCTNIGGGNFNEAIDVAEVYFRPFPDDLADRLIDEGSCFQCAGGLMVEHPLVAPHVEKIVGGIDSVMGLCKQTMLRLLLMAAAPHPKMLPQKSR